MYRQIETAHGGIRQLWVVYQSAELQTRQEKTIPTVIQKELARAWTALGNVTRPEYACEEDAWRALERWSAEHPESSIASTEIQAIAWKMTGIRGHFQNGEAMGTGHKVEVTIEPNDSWYTRERLKLGRLVLATNDPTFHPIACWHSTRTRGPLNGDYGF
jgi:transposase